MSHSYKYVVRKPEGKRPFRELKPRWQVSMKMHIEEIAYGRVD
jgi:hypothetical protein